MRFKKPNLEKIDESSVFVDILVKLHIQTLFFLFEIYFLKI